MSYLVNDQQETKFDGKFLTSVPGLTILAINPYLPPIPKLTIGEIARRSKSVVSSQFYTDKSIIIKVALDANTRVLVEENKRTLFGMLHGREKDLLVKEAGLLCRYEATYSNYNMLVQGGSHLEIELIFKLSDQFGYDMTLTTALNVSNTSGATAQSISFLGNAPTQVPIITLTYSATDATAQTSMDISIGNNLTGQQINIVDTTIAAGVATYIINCQTQTVTKDGVDIMSLVNGTFPEFVPGLENYLTYNDDIITRTVQILATYYKRYV